MERIKEEKNRKGDRERRMMIDREREKNDNREGSKHSLRPEEGEQ